MLGSLFLLYIYVFLHFLHLKRTSPLGSAVEQRPKTLVNATGNLFPQQFRSMEQNKQKELRFSEVAKQEWLDEVHSGV